MLDGTKMYVDVTVTDASSSKRTLHMLVDTGAELAAWFRTQGDDPIPLPSKRFSSFIGKGLNGNILGEFGKMADIQLADFSLENVLVAFPDSVSIAQTLVQSDRNGTIGAQLLKRFNLIVDQQNQALYIKPNKNFNAPFLYNLAGMEVTKEAFSFSLPEIYYVREGSAAQKAGIREGDLIYEINGESGFKIELQELKHHLETPTEKIWMVLLRNGKIQKVSFPLKALL